MSFSLTFRYIGQPEAFSKLLRKNVNRFLYESYVFYKAARVIQKNVRGFLTRRCLQNLHRCAIQIQKTWRGYFTRNMIMQYIKQRFLETRKKYYDKMAGIIQKAWRLYKTRNDFKKLDKHQFYIDNELVNKKMIKKMHAFFNDQIKLQNEELSKEKLEWMNYILPKLHHLIRTKKIPGVYSLKDGRTELSHVEKLLASYNFSTFMSDLKIARARCAKQS